MSNLVEVLKSLSSEPRIKIVQLLKGRRLCVNAITCKLGISQSAVSQHLRILKGAGIVKSEKRGYWMHYSVNEKSLARHMNTLHRILSIEKATVLEKGESQCAAMKKKRVARTRRN
jgi:DNA-binding transcriptional ArsR family regulator